jgi:S1-C subfamily serine protease
MRSEIPQSAILSLCLAFACSAFCLPSCKPAPPATEPAPATEITPDIHDPARSVVRINATLQAWNPWQPWEKDAPTQRRALGALVAPRTVVTTAELAAEAIFLEFESIDGTRFAPAKTIAIDYEANLALLTTQDANTADEFFADTAPFALASPPRIGDSLSLVQVEANGSVLQTSGKLQSVDVTSTLVPGGGFLTYMVKASMQNAASSYSLPVLHDGRLAGMLLTYNSKDQICDVGSTEILSRFVTEGLQGPWPGFPSLGISIVGTEDPSFRQWLKLTDDHGGIYIRHVRKGSAAESGGIQKGDVLLAIDGIPIDRRGYCIHPHYGNLFWGHWIRGEKSTGDPATLSLWRGGAPLEKIVPLAREDDAARIVPLHHYDHAPNYLVKGGLIFQELSLPMLQSFGEDWQTQAPLDLLSPYQNPEAHEDKVERIVFLSGVIPHPPPSATNASETSSSIKSMATPSPTLPPSSRHSTKTPHCSTPSASSRTTSPSISTNPPPAPSTNNSSSAASANSPAPTALPDPRQFPALHMAWSLVPLTPDSQTTS